MPLLGIASAEGFKPHLPYGQRVTLETGSLVVGLCGVLLLAGIRWSGWWAVRHRSFYERAVRSGLTVTAWAFIAVMALQAVVAVAMMGLIGGLVGIHAQIALGSVTGVAAAVGVAAIARRVLSSVRPPDAVVIATRLDRPRAARLYDRVESIAETLDAPRPQQIVVGLEPDVFTSDASLSCMDGTHSGRTLYCSLPLARILTSPELDALIGHELRHPRPQTMDTEETARFPIVPYYAEAFSAAASKELRERELSADRDAARVAGPIDVASAFAKAHAMSVLWARIQSAAAHKPRKGRSPHNLSKAGADLAASKSHLEAVASFEPAISMIDSVEELEAQLSSRYDVRVDKTPPGRARAAKRRSALGAR